MGQPKRIPGMPIPQLLTREPLVTSILNKGMWTSVDPADIDPGALVLAKNVDVRYDKTSRRAGWAKEAARHDANPIDMLIEFRQGTTSILLVRLTRYSMATKPSLAGAWVAVTIGHTERPINYAIIEGTLYFTTGSDIIQTWVFGAGATVPASGNFVPAARFITGAADRVVAASTGDTPLTRSTIYWSGNRNFQEFDGAVDISAGNAPLSISSSNNVDDIAGIFSFGNVVIIPRLFSIWQATRTYIDTNPFNFYEAIPGVGCDVPRSIAIGENGLLFLSRNDKMIYLYRPGQAIQEVGVPIAVQATLELGDAADVFSHYDRFQNEYILGIKDGAGDAKAWKFNFRTPGWTYNEFELGSSIVPTAFSTQEILSGFTSFDELIGTFDALTGTFDELSADPVRDQVLLLGDSDGYVWNEDLTVDQDNSVDFDAVVQSKEFSFPQVDTLLNEIRIEYDGSMAGTYTLEYSKDGGTTWTTAKAGTVNASNRQIIKFNKTVRARRITWRLTATDGRWDLLGYEVHVQRVGDSRK